MKEEAQEEKEEGGKKDCCRCERARSGGEGGGERGGRIAFFRRAEGCFKPGDVIKLRIIGSKGNTFRKGKLIY